MDTIELKPRFSTLATSPQKFHDVFVELDQQNSIVLFEVGGQSGRLSDMLRLLGIEFKVANVNHPSWKWSNNPNKSDKNDAHRLAVMYHCGNFPEVYVPVKQVRQKRALIYYRQKIVNRSTQVKNSIRALTTTCYFIADRSRRRPPHRRGARCRYRRSAPFQELPADMQLRRLYTKTLPVRQHRPLRTNKQARQPSTEDAARTGELGGIALQLGKGDLRTCPARQQETKKDRHNRRRPPHVNAMLGHAQRQ